MSRRSKAAYHAQIERPIAWCEKCPPFTRRNARFSHKDGLSLCKDCRAKLRANSHIEKVRA